MMFSRGVLVSTGNLITHDQITVSAAEESRLAWLWLPAALSVFAYPFALDAFHAAYAAHGFAPGAVLAISVAYSVPAFAVWVAWRLGRIAHPRARTLVARRAVHLFVATPPIFTLMGVLLYLMKINNADIPTWIGLWTAIGLIFALTTLTINPDTPAPTISDDTRRIGMLRVTHGYVAVGLLILFLASHLLNHVFGLVSSEKHTSVMEVLRVIYRNAWVEPVLIALVFFQVLSGLVLWRPRTAEPTDFLGTLQTASGAYLGMYLVAHVNSVFTLARYFDVDTNWDWATGAPAGLAADAWNVRLIPHYSLAVFMLLAHLACGLRIVMRAHRVPELHVGRLTWSLVFAGALVAIVISSAILGARF